MPSYRGAITQSARIYRAAITQIGGALSIRATSSQAQGNAAAISIYPRGYQQVTITSPLAPLGRRIDTTPADLVPGNVVFWGDVQGTGNVIVYANGDFSADSGVTAFSVVIFDHADSTWSVKDLQTVSLPTASLAIRTGQAQTHGAALVLGPVPILLRIASAQAQTHSAKLDLLDRTVGRVVNTGGVAEGDVRYDSLGPWVRLQAGRVGDVTIHYDQIDDSETILSSEWAVSPNLRVLAHSTSGRASTVWIADLEPGGVYFATNYIRTSAPRTTFGSVRIVGV